MEQTHYVPRSLSMKFNRHWIYRQIRNWRRIIPCILLGGIIGGAHGAIHEQ
jgi:hypothetical protein